jgi:hypothetical protein
MSPYLVKIFLIDMYNMANIVFQSQRTYKDGLSTMGMYQLTLNLAKYGFIIVLTCFMIYGFIYSSDMTGTYWRNFTVCLLVIILLLVCLIHSYLIFAKNIIRKITYKQVRFKI